MAGFDVIGDVHGYAAKLEGLLQAMGYALEDGAWRHPTRQVVFVGDLIDRGPEQVRTVRLAQAMVQAGSAQIVMGNHEFNAIAWATPDPNQPGAFLRPHTDKNRHQHRAFLDEVEDDPELHRELIDWFITIPLWLDLGGLRAVHACWSRPSMEAIGPMLTDDRCMTPAFLVDSSRKGHDAYEAVETLLKGPEIELPKGIGYVDKDGHERHRARFSWWNGSATTLREGAEIPPNTQGLDGQPMRPLPDTPIDEAQPLPLYTDDVPVIYGHYWRTGRPHVVTATAACVDYSAGTPNGPLVAYRWDGESSLTNESFVAFPPMA